MAAVSCLVAFLVTVTFMFALRPVAREVGLVDVPGGRKLHEGPVPVIGGVAMVLGLAFGASLVELPDYWNGIALGTYLLVVVGVIDDRYELPPSVRLVAQAGASVLAVFAAGLQIRHLGTPLFFDAPLGAFAPLFTALVVISVINAFNFVDGIDGLAAGLALIAFAAMAALAGGGDALPLALLLVAVTGAFLLFNFPAAFNRTVRAFMGDAGSTLLGFSVACLGIALTQGGGAPFAPVVGLWLAAVPLWDLFSAFARRLLDGKSPFTPGHDHLHYALIRHGLAPRRALAVMLAVAIACAAAGIAGHIGRVADGVLFVLWAAGGVAYDQLVRRPKAVVRAVEALFAAAQRRPVRSA